MVVTVFLRRMAFIPKWTTGN